MLQIRMVLKLGRFHQFENFQEACNSQLVKNRFLCWKQEIRLFQSFEKFQEAGKSQKAKIGLEWFSC